MNGVRPAAGKPMTDLLGHGLIQDPGPIPLVIGVVGHRDPVASALPVLREHLRRQLEQLLHELPSTPLLMLNGLAEGMDTVAAQVFLEVVAHDQELRCEKAPAHQLLGALPKTPAAFAAEDFQDPEALTVLEGLLSSCDGVLHPGNCPALRLPPSPDGLPHAPGDPSCYGRQGIFLVRNSYLLLAFFDGLETMLVGGTSQSVAMQKGEIHPLFVGVEEVLNRSESGILIHHQTPRRKLGSPQQGSGSIHYWPMAPEPAIEHAQQDEALIPKHLLKVPLHIEAMNREISEPDFKPTIYREGLMTRLWSLADKKAQDNKGFYEGWCRLLVITGFTLILLSQLSDQLHALWWALLFIAFIVFPRLQNEPKHEFISYRCLAECLTVQHIWSAARIDDSAADLFLPRCDSELAWIRTVVRSVGLQLLSFYSHEERHEQQALQKARLWMEGQLQYLTDTIQKLGRKARRWKIIAQVLAVLALLVALLQDQPWMPQTTGSWVVVLVAGFGSAIAYSDLMGYEDTQERFAISLAQFRRAIKALNVIKPETPQSSLLPYEREKIVLEAIGLEKLEETNQWAKDQLRRVYAPGS
jgi:hypothetical protein